jgi:hypothetical protein
MFSFSFLDAQKHDYIWITGYSSNLVDTTFGGTIIDFNYHPVDISYEFREPNIALGTFSICDSSGILEFYTNGCEIFGSDNQLLENGDSINFQDRVFNSQCSDGMPSSQHILTLHKPGSLNIYFLFHKFFDFYSSPPIGSVNPSFLYSKVDMNFNNGSGKVITKNQEVFKDTLLPGELSAVKHANGKDWWIINMHYEGQKYYATLFTENGIDTTLIDTIGPYHEPGTNGWSNSVFSPDGKHYARYDRSTQLVLYDFDRTSGRFKDFEQIFIDSIQNLNPGGLAFSPNSRFLYHSNGYYLYQLDLESNTPDLDKTLIATYQKVPNDFFDSGFNKCQLGPDCNIYITPFSSSQKLNVIYEPDLKGKDCTFVQHAITLPTRNDNSLSFHPNYRLGPIGDEGYPCDSTLVLNSFTWKEKEKVKVFPNPVVDFLNIQFPLSWSPANFEIFDISGVLHFKKELLNSGEQLSLQNLPSGIYFYRLISKKGKVGTGKVLKVE